MKQPVKFYASRKHALPIGTKCILRRVFINHAKCIYYILIAIQIKIKNSPLRYIFGEYDFNAGAIAVACVLKDVIDQRTSRLRAGYPRNGRLHALMIYSGI